MWNRPSDRLEPNTHAAVCFKGNGFGKDARNNSAAHTTRRKIKWKTHNNKTNASTQDVIARGLLSATFAATTARMLKAKTPVAVGADTQNVNDRIAARYFWQL
ncbi:hypothetical protein BH20ACI2_BH20ACI2_10350 [soil metagenome]